MFNSQWLEQPMSRINLHGPKDVRAIEVRLYKAEGQEVSQMEFYFGYRKEMRSSRNILSQKTQLNDWPSDKPLYLKRCVHKAR